MTGKELEQIGDELVQEGRICDYLIEEGQSGELRLLVRDAEDKDYSLFPIRPAD